MALFNRKQLPERQERTPAAAAAVSSPSAPGATSTSGSTSGSPSATRTVEPPPAPAGSKDPGTDPANNPAEEPTGGSASAARKQAGSPAGASRTTDKKGSDKSAAGKMVDGANAVRSRVASIVWLVAVVCAMILAVAALMVALKANNDNAIVSFVKDTAHTLDLGVFSPSGGIFTPTHDPLLVKAALINWGIAAVLYLVVGKIADRIIRP